MSRRKNDESPRSETAYRRLLQAIQRGTLKPGTRVREAEIAQGLGISRTPVRDAIRRLEGEGLIVHVPRDGAVVKRLDAREIIELYEIREVLEGAAARMAALRASDVEVSELEDLNALMRECGRDPIRAADANRQFHGCLYEAAKNRYLIDAVTALANAMTLLRGTTLTVGDRCETAYTEHEEIVDGIRNRDPDRAGQAASAHIRASQKIRHRMEREASRDIDDEPTPNRTTL